VQDGVYGSEGQYGGDGRDGGDAYTGNGGDGAYSEEPNGNREYAEREEQFNRDGRVEPNTIVSAAATSTPFTTSASTTTTPSTTTGPPATATTTTTTTTTTATTTTTTTTTTVTTTTTSTATTASPASKQSKTPQRREASFLRGVAKILRSSAEGEFVCKSQLHLDGAVAMENKGLAIDDTTFSQCPSQALTKWPNSAHRLTSIRLFKAWDSSWDGKHDRKAIWKSLRDYIWKNNVKVLFGTQITCNETADDADWAYVRELMAYIGSKYTMGLAIGNEVELLHTHAGLPPGCIPRIFQQGYFHIKVVARAEDLKRLDGFENVLLTTVMGGFVLGGAPFVNTPEAGVASFFNAVTQQFGERWVFTWNVYPYFDPNVQVNPNDVEACGKVLAAAQSFEPSGMIAAQLRELRLRTQQVTARTNDTTWLGETGWSWPRADTLATAMSQCQNFSDRKHMMQYYRNFLQWDLSLGMGSAPINHVFYFTMRDASNWHLSEFFGLVHNCSTQSCKLQ